jgi:hypothetical protein
LDYPHDLPIVTDGLADLMGFESCDTKQRGENEIVTCRKKQL